MTLIVLIVWIHAQVCIRTGHEHMHAGMIARAYFLLVAIWAQGNLAIILWVQVKS